MYCLRANSKRFIVWNCVLIIIISGFVFSYAHAQNDADRVLKEAQDKYEQGYFPEVIELLDSYVTKKRFARSEQRDDAYALLARAYIAMDYPGKVEKTIKKLLKSNKNYEPSTPMDSKFRQLVREINAQQNPPEKKSNMKYWIIGGTAVGAGVALVTMWALQPKEEKPLPGPPSPPN